MRKKLEFQADRIEGVLTVHKIQGRVTGGTVTPRWVRFQVLTPVPSQTDQIKDLGEELAAALGVTECQLSRCEAAVTVEVARDDPQPVQLIPLYRQLMDGSSIPPMTAVLGLAEDGAPLLIRLPSPDVGNILVVGVGGAGKSSLLRTIRLSLEWANPDANLSTVHIVDDLETCDLARSDGVVRLAQRQDEYVIAATADISLARRIGELFPVRIVGRVASAEDAYAVAGCSGARAEKLTGQGDFLAVVEGRVTRFQAAYISSKELKEVKD